MMLPISARKPAYGVSSAGVSLLWGVPVTSGSAMSSGFRAAAAGGGGGAPGGEVGQRPVDLGGAGGQLLGAERGQADAVGLVHLGVPLLDPGLELGQPGDQRDEPVAVPAVG